VEVGNRSSDKSEKGEMEQEAVGIDGERQKKDNGRRSGDSNEGTSGRGTGRMRR
jgi:hypothetical protein